MIRLDLAGRMFSMGASDADRLISKLTRHGRRKEGEQALALALERARRYDSEVEVSLAQMRTLAVILDRAESPLQVVLDALRVVLRDQLASRSPTR